MCQEDKIHRIYRKCLEELDKEGIKLTDKQKENIRNIIRLELREY